MNHFSKIKKSLSLIFYFLGLYLLMNSEFDYSSSSKTYSRLIYSVFFAFVILEQSFSQNPVFRLSSIPGFNYLGKISFGLYCLHQPALLISTWFSTSVIHPQSWWIQYLCIIIPGMLLSVLFATFSYWLIEKPILSYKEKFNVFER